MSSQGPSLPSAASTTAAGGTTDWTNPANAKAIDGSYTSALDSGLSSQTYRLCVSGFPFAIPAGATLTGYVVRLGKRSNTGTPIQDATVQLTADGSSGVGSNKADTVTNWSSSLTAVDYGGSSDLWGASLVPADVNASTFGVFVAATLSPAAQADIDYVQVTVYYTVAWDASQFPHPPTSTPPRLRATIDAVAY